MASVNNFHLMGLVEDGSVSYVEDRQNEVWLAGIAMKVAHKKFC